MRIFIVSLLLSCTWPAYAQQAGILSGCVPGVSCPPAVGEFRPQITPLANKEMEALRPRLLECNKNIVDAIALAYRPGYEKCAETQSQWEALMLAEKERLRARSRQILKEIQK